MTPLDDRIRTGLEQLSSAAAPPSVRPDDVLATIAERRRSRQTLRTTGALGLVAVLAVALLAAVATTGRFADDAQVITEPTPDPTVELTPDPGPVPDRPTEGDATITGSEAPLAPRHHVAAVWTGSELVLWGGSEPGQNDGAAYDPADDTWRTIPPAPIATSLQRWSRAEWTGEEVVVFHGRSVAAWDPGSTEWRELPNAPGEVGDVVWTGEELVVTRMASTDQAAAVAGALHPATGRWRELPSVGKLDELTLSWTGDELIALGRNVEYPWLGIEGRTLDPETNTWRELARGPIEARGYGATWAGDRIVVVNYHGEAASYDPATDTWTELPGLLGSSGGVALTTVHDHVLVGDGGGFVIGDRFGRWVPIWPVVSGVSVEAGPDLLLQVSIESYDDDGSVDHHPPRVVSVDVADLIDPPVIWFAGLQVVRSVRVEFERFEVLGDPPMRTGVVTTFLVDGEACTVEVRFGMSVVGTPSGEAVTVEPPHGGEVWTGYLSDGGATLQMPVGYSFLRCDDPARTLTLARSLVPPARSVVPPGDQPRG